MPKESSPRSLSSNNTRSSPYPSCSNRASGAISRKDLGAEKDRKEWEEVRCPVCMEHPHNAVLLKCSSYDKGCRPYICNTSCRHSNCLDQFCKAFANPKTDEIEGASSSNHRNTGDYGSGRKHPKFICPLCRGDVSDWIVVEAARNFMNSKTRSCASETCDYSGMYADLRRHARLVHPFVRPFEVDPERERCWTRMEQERDFGDLLSTIQSTFDDDNIEGDNFMVGSPFMNVVIFLHYRRTSSISTTEANSPGRENETSAAESFSYRRILGRISRRLSRSRSLTPSTRLWPENTGNEGDFNSIEDERSSSQRSTGTSRRNQQQRR